MIIRKEALQAVMPATDASDSRYFVTAVEITPATHQVAATNGFILLIATDHAPQDDKDFPQVPGGVEHQADPEKSILVPLAVCTSILGVMPKRTRMPILNCAQLSQGSAEEKIAGVISATNLAVSSVQRIREDADQQRFPKFQQIIDKNADRPEVHVTLSLLVLEALIKSAKAVQHDKGRALQAITFSVPTAEPHVQKDGYVIGPLKVAYSGSDVAVTGLALPMRK